MSQKSPIKSRSLQSGHTCLKISAELSLSFSLSHSLSSFLSEPLSPFSASLLPLSSDLSCLIRTFSPCVCAREIISNPKICIFAFPSNSNKNLRFPSATNLKGTPMPTTSTATTLTTTTLTTTTPSTPTSTSIKE